MSDYSPKDRISQTPSSDSGRKSHKGTIIAIMCTLIVVAAIIIAVIFLNKPDSPSDATKKKRNVLVTAENVDEILNNSESVNQNAASYTISMTSTDWTFKDGKSTSADSYVENSTKNSTPVYFDIVRSDTGETIYSSPIIPVGSHLDNFKLDKDLDAGTYDCVMTYYLVDDDQNVLSHVNLAVTITIEN